MNEMVSVNHKEYWHIRMKPGSVIWHHVMHRLISSVEIEAWNDWIRTMHEDNGDHIYLLNKMRYPAAITARTFGVDTETLAKVEELVLDEPDEKALPKPTVDYYGEA